MFEKMSEAAERLATGASRREFLGQLGKGALALTGVLAGVLAFSSRAQAASKSYCCVYSSGGVSGGVTCRVCSAVPCPSTFNSLPLSSWSSVNNCRQCGRGCIGY
jgi:hypothetical protein